MYVYLLALNANHNIIIVPEVAFHISISCCSEHRVGNVIFRLFGRHQNRGEDQVRVPVAVDQILHERGHVPEERDLWTPSDRVRPKKSSLMCSAMLFYIPAAYL